ncbi:bifunctional 3,4-dihydroxy-2-butanone-4-phosphate synthase/GTP cyclohydrolase II [Paraglaciecola hydrolytica]|uniref:3,4-dihydroxy-2-butanone 4-phosphate synthase n=1 Tax=Paraglaciecola hydrolytica TaxID=1799789 RepID=A0A148KKB7_9ALTE|nr:bifunctional 3,4-dihydroxy-2-butanone-4-phosphate synthase/GTP cyclohydrolase II [Paraglaciecola hydrolytica]KXI26764.1 3,4-dihydroxy-2-butanone 4-phosphate synthase [Paraglaciecola hydrolytica]
MQLNTYEEIIDDFRQGKMVILLDDEDRENEGDILMAASCVEAEHINFMAKHARGLICLTLTEERCRQLNLPLMVRDNTSQHTTNFTVSIEAARGISTGISAADRAQTVRLAVAPNAVPQDLVQPGHIFPIMAQAGGVLSRAGHTEAGCDLARLAGLEPAAVIVEVMNEDGSMARRPELEVFAKLHNIKIATIAGLIQYRMVRDRTIECINQRKVTTLYGDFVLKTYFNSTTNEHHFALIKGDISEDNPTLVRVHVGNTAKDVFSIRQSGDDGSSWDCRAALKYIAEEGSGVLVYICHSESTADIEESIDYLLHGKRRRANPDMAYKQVGAGSQILRDLGIKKLRLLSAPVKFLAISGFDLEVVEYIACDNKH